MGLWDQFNSLFGKQPATPDEIAIRYTQSMLAGDEQGVARLSVGKGVRNSREMVRRFAEADLARWFHRFRSLDAPAVALPNVAAELRRYIVGRVSLPDGGVQDFPVMTVGLVQTKRGWAIVSARANSALFEEAPVEAPPESEVIQIDPDIVAESDIVISQDG